MTVISSLTTQLWLAEPIIPVPGSTPSSTPSPGSSHFNNDPAHTFQGSDKLQAIIGYVSWIAGAVAIATLMGIGVRWVMNLEGGGENPKYIGRWIGGALLVSLASSIANTVFGFNLFTSNPEAIPGLSAVQTGLSIASAVAGGLCLIGIIWTGVTIMLRIRHGEPIGERLIWILAGCAIVGGAASITYAILP